MLKRFILLSLLLIAAFTASADVFTVTSNADAGAGTLREALTMAAANGSAVKDYINFNIADQSEAGRTIILNTALPDLSPNLVINGLTQPGTVFGVSASKINIQATYTSSDPAKIYIFTGDNIGDFSMSGLYLSTTSDYSNNLNPISISNSNEIHIDHCLIQSGAVFLNTCMKFTFQSNILGYLPDGIIGHPSAITIWDNLDVNIGGDASQGNLMSGSINLKMFKTDQDWTYLISNNKMGTDYTGISSSPSLYSPGRIDIESGHYDPPGTGKMHGTIANNLIENFSSNGLTVSGFGNVAIKGNSIGTDNTGTINFFQFAPDYVQNSTGYAPTAIVLQVGIDAVVGGDNPEDANKIAFVSNGILEQLANQVIISKNSIYCLNGNFFNIHDFVTQAYTKPLPVVQINSIISTAISGTATPGARVELFSNTEGTCASCEPKSFFTYVTANAQGNWSYNGAVPVNVVASAIYNNQTSLFTKAKIDINDLKVTQPSCGDNTGAIEGIKFYNAGQVRWVDESGTIISNSVDVNGLSPGKYKLKIGSDVCGAESDWIEISDNSLIIDVSKLNIKPATCNSWTGLIWGITANQPVILTWHGEGNLGGTEMGTEISNVPPGNYSFTFTKLDGSCAQTISPIIVPSTSSLSIDQSQVITNPSSCTISNGSIHGITATGVNVKYSWKNEQNVEVGTLANLDNQPAGTYTLTITDDSNCGPTTSLPMEILSANDIIINSAPKNVQDASCGIASGAITNIQVTGTGTYLWTNEQGVDVGHDKDLTDVPAGKYRLTVSSANCPPVSTEVIEILEVNGITIDDTQKIISKATCQYDNGGISNIQVTGATKYTWYNAGNNAVSNNLNLTGMPAGNYYLIAANNNGCSKQTAVYAITRQAPVSYGGLTKKLKNATCDENNGSIEVIFQDAPAALPDSYKWVNTATGQVVNTSTPILTGIDAGTYDIYGITNGCEQYIINYAIGRDPGLNVVTNNIQKNDDHCAAGTGSIKGIQATGATPLSFTWTDDNGANKGASADLLNIPAGTYHLKITDGANCEQGFVYTIYDQSDNITPPTVNNVQLCSPGSALLSVSNADSRYRYRLYEDNNSAAPIDEQQNGSFKVYVNTGRSYYISQYAGNCESTRQEVNVSISGISGADIANTFTPNGDGINDYWKITGMQSYTNGTVKVFNRDGKMVYQSKGYAVPFDGTLNGKPLPTGVYYYIIDLKSCNLISGNLTILR